MASGHRVLSETAAPSFEKETLHGRITIRMPGDFSMRKGPFFLT